MEFDLSVAKTVSDGEEIEYGIIFGGDAVVFIKSGKGGTVRGHFDKHLKMARRLNERGGYTVICASNPLWCKDSSEIDKAVINEHLAERGITAGVIHLFGSSNGGLQCIFLAEKLDRVGKVIMVNMPLMINYHKTLALINRIKSGEKIFVYGEKDPSYSYLPYLKARALKDASIIEIKGADHVFEGMTEEFIELEKLI